MVLLLNPLKIRVDRSSFSWVSGHQRAPQYLQFILQLQWWIAIVWTSGFLQIFQWTLSALSRVLPLSDGLSVQDVLVFIHTLAQCCFIIPGGSAHSWQQLPNFSGEVMTSSFLLSILLHHFGKFFGSIFDCGSLYLFSNIKSTMNF